VSFNRPDYNLKTLNWGQKELKRKLFISVSILTLIIVCTFIFFRFNPPLEIGTFASSGDHKSVVVGVGNQGFQKVRIVEVLVNNNDIPVETKIQVGNALQGFVITDDYKNEEAEEYRFMNVNDVTIKAGTSPSSNFEKLDDGTATKKDEIYGVSVCHDKEIDLVMIKYSYFGIPFSETVVLN